MSYSWGEQSRVRLAALLDYSDQEMFGSASLRGAEGDAAIQTTALDCFPRLKAGVAMTISSF
jgi:hypothetical protein